MHACCYTFMFIVDYKVHPGLDPRNPAASCAEILSNGLNAPSGYYWLQSANGSAVRVFCDMTLTCKGVGGGWMQVAKLDMTNSSHQCPPGTRLRNDLLWDYNKSLCRINFDGLGCSSTTFGVHDIQYRQVCGKIIAYQDASPDAFGELDESTRNVSIDGNYVDGISLVHGINPRQHIWTFAGALDEVRTHPQHTCPCTNINQAASSTQPPSFVGNDYFVTLLVKINGHTHSTQMTPYGMELVVDQPTPAVHSTTLHGSWSSCHPPQLMISRWECVVINLPETITLRKTLPLKCLSCMFADFHCIPLYWQY